MRCTLQPQGPTILNQQKQCTHCITSSIPVHFHGSLGMSRVTKTLTPLFKTSIIPGVIWTSLVMNMSISSFPSLYCKAYHYHSIHWWTVQYVLFVSIIMIVITISLLILYTPSNMEYHPPGQNNFWPTIANWYYILPSIVFVSFMSTPIPLNGNVSGLQMQRWL